MPANRITDVDLEGLIDFVSAGFVILSERGRVTYINGFAAGALGGSVEELLGQDFWALPRHQAGSEIYERLRELVRSTRPGEFEARAPQTGDWVRVHVSPAGDATIIYFVDITLTRQSITRLEVEKAVTLELAKSSSIQQAAPGLIAQICELLELDAGGLWLPSAEDGELKCAEFGVIHGEVEDLQAFKEQSYRASFAPGEGLPGRVWKQRRAIRLARLAEDLELLRLVEGENPFQSGFAFPIMADGECLGVLEFYARRLMVFREPKLGMMSSLGVEIGQFMLRWQTQRSLAAEEAMRAAVVKSALDAVVIMDVEGRIQGFNPAAEKLFGYQAEEVLGGRLSDYLIPPALRARHERGYRRYLRTGEGRILGKRVEIQAMRADGTQFPCELAITQAHLADRPPTFVGYVHDITLRKQAEESLVFAREQAERMTELKSSLLANISHEIRTPLTSIMIWTTVLRESGQEASRLSKTQRRALKTIERSAQRLTDTLDSVLTLAQLAGRAITPEPRRLSLQDMAADMVAKMEDLAAKKDLDISLEVQGERSDIMADPRFLTRVLAHLASNAVKFTPEGAIKVSVSGDGERVILQVEDTGVGIEPEFIPEVFEDFAQESSGLSRAYEGSGLGLATSKRLLEMMDAQIALESEKDEGTLVTLTFESADAQGLSEQPQDMLSAFGQPAGGKYRVLLIEDNIEVRLSAAEALAQVADVVAFPDGERALAGVKAREFDLIILDISLPGLDGIETLSKLREFERLRHLPALALTAHALPGDREFLGARGFSDYLLKPFKRDALLQAVGQLLATASADTPG